MMQAPSRNYQVIIQPADGYAVKDFTRTGIFICAKTSSLNLAKQRVYLPAVVLTSVKVSSNSTKRSGSSPERCSVGDIQTLLTAYWHRGRKRSIREKKYFKATHVLKSD